MGLTQHKWKIIHADQDTQQAFWSRLACHQDITPFQVQINMVQWIAALLGSSAPTPNIAQRMRDTRRMHKIAFAALRPTLTRLQGLRSASLRRWGGTRPLAWQRCPGPAASHKCCGKALGKAASRTSCGLALQGTSPPWAALSRPQPAKLVSPEADDDEGLGKSSSR